MVCIRCEVGDGMDASGVRHMQLYFVYLVGVMRLFSVLISSEVRECIVQCHV